MYRTKNPVKGGKDMLSRKARQTRKDSNRKYRTAKPIQRKDSQTRKHRSSYDKTNKDRTQKNRTSTGEHGRK
jgi:hypothetical protein